MNEIEIILDVKTIIGESPLWSPEEAALYMIDVKAPALFRLHTATGQLDRWVVPSDLGAFTLLPDRSGALVALRSGLHTLAFADGAVSRLAPPPYDPAIHRFNEGGCDPEGRFWVGVMFDPIDPKTPPQPSSLHSFTSAGGLVPAPDSAELHNGMAWSADGGRMFLSHSGRGEIFSFPIHDGRLGQRTLFATVAKANGIPDGAALDTDGGYWCALHGGGALRRFYPDGSLDRDIALPVSQPTQCSFGGPDLTDLYITSATDKLTQAQLRQQPLAGALLRVRPGEQGVARRCTFA